MRKLTNSGQVRRNDETVPHNIQIRSLQTVDDGEIQALSDVLIDCVEGGASVGFMQPLSRAKANAFWLGVAAAVGRGERLLLAAADAAGAILGTVQIVFAQFENQPHRADIAKMLVHRRARRHGIGRGQDAAGARYRKRRCRAVVCQARLAALRHHSPLRPVARGRLLRYEILLPLAVDARMQNGLP